VDSCPKESFPEYAFVGRSNVGKSSLINYLADHKKLAKTSSHPGHTQLINHFIVDDTWYMVDLPGYGYAKVSKSKRKEFSSIISNYLLKRKSLVCLFVLIDCRHAPLANDLDFMRWLGVNGIPFVICFTKTDKLSSSALNKAVTVYKNTMLKEWESLPQVFLTSTTQNQGKEEILDYINSLNRSVTPNHE
jgi:GTP-binding protein